MAQFNYGSNAGNTSNAPGFNFGAQKPATPAFGNTQPSGSITFGTPLASVASTQPSTGFGFGSTAPTLGQGLNFGTPAATAPTLGQGLNFGNPAATASQTGLSFGTPAPAGSLSFGTPSFGAPTMSAAPLSFGATPISTPAPSFNFKAPTTTSTGLNFAAPSTSTNFNLGSTLGATPSTATTGLFSTPTKKTGLEGLTFNQPASTAATGFMLGAGGATTAVPTLSLGTPATAASTGLSFGLGGATAAKTPTLNFSTPFTSASTSGGLNFGFNTPAKTQTTALSLSTATTTTGSVGLGGVDSSQTKMGTANVGQVDKIAAKENAVPNEIIQSIESFKTFVKEQKTHSSDVARGSARPFLRVGEDIDLLNSTLSEVGNDLQRNQQLADKLKHDSAKSLRDAEMAQRTFETPPGLQFENNAPLQYFIELVNQFEQDLQALRLQIDTTDKHIQSLHEPKFLTSQELAQGMRKLHDTFVALAGRLQSVHTQVESQKEQYFNLRKYILKDPTNIFIQKTKEQEALNVALQGLTNVQSKAEPGPTPFSTLGSSFGLNAPINLQQTPSKPPPAYPSSTPNLNFASPVPSTTNFLGQPTTTSLSSGLLFGGSPAQNPPTMDSSAFQLQNPPPGNKRGKR